MKVDKNLIVLVDEHNNEVGYKEKLEAHKHPVPLHRAISVLIVSPDKKSMLIQKRAAVKPTWPQFWSNACCTHPFIGESSVGAAKRRLKEELGINTDLKKLYDFVYKADYDATFGEHEVDSVYLGYYSGKIQADAKEVADYKWVEISRLAREIAKDHDSFTPWFREIFENFEKQKPL